MEARYLVGADGANGVVARTFGLGADIRLGVALEGNVSWGTLEPEPYRGTAWVELGVVPGGYGWVFPKEITRTSGWAGGSTKGRSSDRTWPGLPARTESTQMRSPRFEGTGCRCDRSARSPVAVVCSSSATRRGSSIPSQAMASTRPSFRRGSPRTILAGRPEEYEAALAAALDRHAARLVEGQAGRGSLPARVSWRCGRLESSTRWRGSCAATLRTRARRVDWHARHYARSRDWRV